MVRSVVAAVVLAAALIPASVASAIDPDDISKPADVLRSADRLGGQVSTVPAPPTAPRITVDMQRVLELVNAERTARGLVPLSFSDELNEAAQQHTQNQADDGGIYHTDPDDGSRPGDRISRTGYEFSTWGENVAAGFSSPQAVMNAWMTSPGHCRNVLNPAFTEIGVGHVTGGVTYDEFWTQKFSRPAGEARPPGTFNSAWC